MGLAQGGILRSTGVYNREGTYGYMFWCPGCEGPHQVNVVPPPEGWTDRWVSWGFNGNTEKPTFTPSILVRYPRHEPPVTPENLEEYKKNPWPQTKVDYVCHSFVTDGRIQFLSDCTHKLKDQTVNLPLWPEKEEA